MMLNISNLNYFLDSAKAITSGISQGMASTKSFMVYGLTQNEVFYETAKSALLISGGTYFCVKAIKDIGAGNLKRCLTKAFVGSMAIALGAYQLIQSGCFD